MACMTIIHAMDRPATAVLAPLRALTAAGAAAAIRIWFEATNLTCRLQYYRSRAQSLRKLLLDLLCPGCPIANLVVTTAGICFAAGLARQVSTIAPYANFRRGRCVPLLQLFAFRTTRHVPLPLYTQGDSVRCL
jgi:hypothetical protein